MINTKSKKISKSTGLSETNQVSSGFRKKSQTPTSGEEKKACRGERMETPTKRSSVDEEEDIKISNSEGSNGCPKHK